MLGIVRVEERVQGTAQDRWERKSGPQAEACLICPSSSGASIQRQVWECHGGHPLKATCFLAHLSMYILTDSLPCVLASRSHFDGKPQQWLRLEITGVGWAPSRCCGRLSLASPDMVVALGVSWLVDRLFQHHVTTPSPSVWPSLGSNRPFVKTPGLMGQGPTVMMVCQLGYI